MNPFLKISLMVLCCFLPGCGIVVGTLIDTTVDITTYPVKEYVFLGSYKYDNTWSAPYQEIVSEKDYGEMLVGLAISGGGSRSAYFTACVMEELSKIPISKNSNKSYLDEVDYISSVSGGSLASVYYCMKRFASPSPDMSQFFKKFKEDMSLNFEFRSMVKLLMFGYWAVNAFTYYDRGDLMASVWDDKIFHDATFDDIIKAESRGAPKLIINGTNLNDGLRFVFSTIDDDNFNRSAFFNTLRQSSFIIHDQTDINVPFKVIGFKSINSDIRPYPVSKAVVASASVPILLGPVTLKDYTKDNRLIHIIDGGVYDNYGLETLMQIVTEYLDRNPGKPAKILVIDGSGYFEESRQDSDRFTVAYYSERPLSISWLRTKNYMEYACRKSKTYKNEQGIRPYENLEIKVISLYNILPSQEQQKNISDDAMLEGVLRADATAGDFLKKLTTIQTRFKISEEDANAIDKISGKVVKRAELSVMDK